MKKIDTVVLKRLREEINEALTQVGKKYSLSLRAGNCSYSESMATFKLEVATIGEGGRVVTKEETQLPRYCELYGFTVKDAEKVFSYKGEDAKVVGINPRKQKFPIVIELLKSKKRYLIPEESALKLMGKVHQYTKPELAQSTLNSEG